MQSSPLLSTCQLGGVHSPDKLYHNDCFKLQDIPFVALAAPYASTTRMECGTVTMYCKAWNIGDVINIVLSAACWRRCAVVESRIAQEQTCAERGLGFRRCPQRTVKSVDQG